MTFIPYEAGTDLQFEKCLPFTLVQEGGFSNTPGDHGGRTQKGITQREYDSDMRAWGLPLADVKAIPMDQLNTIYYTKYWLPECPELSAGLNLSFFDQCVNEGPREAILLLQRSLTISADGIWGEQTDNVVKNITAPRQLIMNYSNQRANFYRGIGDRNPSQQKFMHDWLFRTTTIEKQSLAMLAA